MLNFLSLFTQANHLELPSLVQYQGDARTMAAFHQRHLPLLVGRGENRQSDQQLQ